MARARNIKPAIMDNEELAELGPLTRLLFIYLWMLADREGRLEDRPKRIAAQALAYDRAADVPAMLDDLQCHGFIKRYVSGGVACIQITGFSKHQNPHGTEKNSALPNADGGCRGVVRCRVMALILADGCYDRRVTRLARRTPHEHHQSLVSTRLRHTPSLY